MTFDPATQQFKVEATLPAISGEIRDAKWVRAAGSKPLLVLARNNASPVFLQLNDQ
jgi:hypothetical protein